VNVETVTYDGVQLLTRPGTFDTEMAREIFGDRYYTCGGWDIPAGATVLDIGGGVGAFAAFAASGGAGEVHTFEPIPESFDLLAANVAAWPAVIAEQAAVAVEPGTVRMSGFEPMPDGVINTGLPAISSSGTEVRAVGIHEVLARREHWDVVKLDIEGYEYELLAALTAAEFASIGFITMEFHHDDEATTHQRGLDLGVSLEAQGFTVEVAWAWGLQGRLRARR
jgi:FkbM family methyltransferase